MGSDQATTNLWKGMVFPKCWIGLVWTVAFCVAQTQALLSEDELVRALLAAREAEDSGYMMRGALPVMEKRRQQAFSAWAGKTWRSATSLQQLGWEESTVRLVGGKEERGDADL